MISCKVDPPPLVTMQTNIINTSAAPCFLRHGVVLEPVWGRTSSLPVLYIYAAAFSYPRLSSYTRISSSYLPLSLSLSLSIYRRDLSASQSQFPCSCLYHIAIPLVHDCCFYCLVLFSVHTHSNLYAFFSWWASYIPRSLKSVNTA